MSSKEKILQKMKMVGSSAEYGLGEGYARPNDGAMVEVALEGYYNDRLFDQRELCFEVGEGESLDLPCGLEEAIQRMEKGEHSIVYLKPSYALAVLGRKGSRSHHMLS